MKKDIIVNGIALLTALRWVKNFIPYNMHFYVLAKKDFYCIKKYFSGYTCVIIKQYLDEPGYNTFRAICACSSGMDFRRIVQYH